MLPALTRTPSFFPVIGDFFVQQGSGCSSASTLGQHFFFLQQLQNGAGDFFLVHSHYFVHVFLH